MHNRASPVPAKKLRGRIVRSLRKQGFKLRSGRLIAPKANDKEAIRALHVDAVSHRIERARPGLFRHQDLLQKFIASGHEVVPDRISPRLVEVKAETIDELLFRYARLHWSVPVSAGYGRRIRFLVYDDFNQKLIGLFGLGDPIFAIGPRDRWIGWDKEQRRTHLKSVMELFVLGVTCH
jgi:hypothetical protein